MQTTLTVSSAFTPVTPGIPWWAWAGGIAVVATIVGVLVLPTFYPAVTFKSLEDLINWLDRILRHGANGLLGGWSDHRLVSELRKLLKWDQATSSVVRDLLWKLWDVMTAQDNKAFDVAKAKLIKFVNGLPKWLRDGLTPGVINGWTFGMSREVISGIFEQWITSWAPAGRATRIIEIIYAIQDRYKAWLKRLQRKRMQEKLKNLKKDTKSGKEATKAAKEAEENAEKAKKKGDRSAEKGEKAIKKNRLKAANNTLKKYKKAVNEYKSAEKSIKRGRMSRGSQRASRRRRGK